MKPWTTWLARLGIAGACFFVTGCGGGDIPDASNDGQAVAGGAPDAAAGAGGAAPAAPAPVEGPKVAQGEPGPATDEAPAAATAPTPAPETEPPAETPAPAEGQGKSSTAEMLALANGPAGGSNNASAGDSATPSPDAAPAPGAAPPAGGPGGGMMAGRMGGPGMMGAPGMMGGIGRGGPGPADMEKMRASMNASRSPGPGGPGALGGPGGYGGPGGPGGAGGAGRDNAPPDFHTPTGAVRAFLAALKAKDLNRLNESTALRASTEAASSKSRDLFKRIFDLNLSESELDELASKLDGFNIAAENPPKSTGRVDVVLQKTEKNGVTRRTITARHEKKGWGVLDVSGPTEFKSIGATRRNTSGGRR